MKAEPNTTSNESQEREYLDYIPVDVVQCILTYPARRAAKLAELAAEDADISVDGENWAVDAMTAQENRWAKAGCDVFDAGDVNAFIKSRNPLNSFEIDQHSSFSFTCK